MIWDLEKSKQNLRQRQDIHAFSYLGNIVVLYHFKNFVDLIDVFFAVFWNSAGDKYFQISYPSPQHWHCLAQ